MKEILILGSAAAEAVPAIFCDCRVCRTAWRNGGKEIRKRTAYRLGQSVAIDLGPDTMMQEHVFACHSEQLRHLFFTHSHHDHFTPELLIYRRKGYSSMPVNSWLNVYGTDALIQKLNLHFNAYPAFHCDYGRFFMEPKILESFQILELPDEDMTVIPLDANHMLDELEQPLIYLVRYGKSHILFANDTGFFPEKTWYFLKNEKIRMDVVIMDCTMGILDNEFSHLGGKFILKAKEQLEKISCISRQTRFILNHFSHNGQATHAELEQYYTPYGIEIAYDGMRIPLAE